MKRVANNVAVQTLLYTVSGDQLVRIVDHPNSYAVSYRTRGEIVFDDNACGIHHYKYDKIRRAAIQKMDFEVNNAGHVILVIRICTNEEE